ncbi:MAG: YicC family protein [Firmicutes bacterium]|nr:YicC family protein [Bacillota bacterium]
MTGYGAGQAGNEIVVTVEMRSVNHRYSDYAIHLPREYAFLEDTIREVLAQNVRRGRVEVSVAIEDFREDPRTVKIDWGLLQGYDEAVSLISEHLNLELANRMDYLLSLPGVLEPAAIEEAHRDLISELARAATKAAVQALVEMRASEGRRLAVVLRRYLDALANSLCEVAALAGTVPIEYRERLESRIQELLGDVKIDPNRIAMEVAILAERASIDEELVRLKSHITAFRTTLEENEPVGRKLDFLLQEMNREVNTVGSKTTNVTIAGWVVEAKSNIEKLREQIQNVE